ATAAAGPAAPAAGARVHAEAVTSIAVHGEVVRHAVHNRAGLVHDLRPQQRADDARGGRAVDGDAARQAVRHGEVGAGRRAAADAALVDELLQVLEPLPAETRTDVVGLRPRAEVRRLRRVLPR